MHASGRNSGVLHSGIYYSTDTMKSQLCRVGNERMRQFADEHKILYQRLGKIIIATREEDLPVIERLLENARLSQIRAERLDERGIKEIEPFSNPYRVGIFCPDTAVIDSKGVVNKLNELLSSQKVHMNYGQEVTHIDPQGQKVHTRTDCFGFGFLFNCAGAYSDRLAAHCGLGRDYTLLPFKGVYYTLRRERHHLVRGNIYPVPDINLPFLGVHFTRAMNGNVYVGPTAIPAFGRENYGILEGLKIREVAGISRSLLGLYLSNSHSFRNLVHIEFRKYRKRWFTDVARQLVPDLSIDDLVASSKVGIRPQLVNVRKKRLEMDYIIEQTPHSIHVLNAISPAFTSAFVFAELIVDSFEKGDAGRAYGHASLSASTGHSG